MRQNVVPALKANSVFKAIRKRRSFLLERLNLRPRLRRHAVDSGLEQNTEHPSERCQVQEQGTATGKGLALPEWACENIEEANRLIEMKLLVGDKLEQVRNQPAYEGRTKLEAFPDVYGDLRLLRFLRKDRPQNPVSAARRYEKFLAWRQEQSVDQVRMDLEKQPFQSSITIVSQNMPCKLDVPASEHSKLIPIVLYLGQWHSPAVTALIRKHKLTLQQFLLHWIYMFESLHRQLYLESLRLREMVYVDEVLDLTNISLSQFSPRFVSNILKPWLSMTQTYYPETAKTISLLNPPSIVQFLWNIVAKMVSENTVAKVKLYPGFKGSAQEFVDLKHCEKNPVSKMHRHNLFLPL